MRLLEHDLSVFLEMYTAVELVSQDDAKAIKSKKFALIAVVSNGKLQKVHH